MRRRLFTLASALSMLLCVAMAVLWAASYRVACSVSWEYARPTPRRSGVVRGQVTIADGMVFLVRQVDDTPPALLRTSAGPPLGLVRWRSHPVRGADVRQLIFRFEPNPSAGGPFRWAFQFEIPVGLMMTLLAVPPIAGGARAHRKRRAHSGTA